MYFIGVHTETSMIMRVFPRWTGALELGDCQLVGIDLALHDDPQRYRQVVRFIKEDPLSVGALVTTHKIDLLHAARDLFDELDELAALMGEVSAISKAGGKLVGTAKDPVTAGRALEAFLPPMHWKTSGADAFLLGAGGSSIVLSWYLAQPDRRALPGWGGLAWDFNYWGELVFLRQAWMQERSRSLHVEDGWVYFVIGWLAGIGEVFAKNIPLRGLFFDSLRRIAEAERR
jgi:hypothetical protein